MIPLSSLFIVIFLEGFVSIAIEILTIRQLVPFVGTNVVVTSLIIGVFLLFLAFGYWRGGKYTKDYPDILKRNFTLAAIFIGLGLSYYFIAVFFAASYHLITQNFLFILSLYLLLVISPLVYFLGQTIPITMNLARRDETVGAVGGRVLFLSTIGSFLGAILTTLVLIEFFGVAATVFTNAILLMSLIFFLPRTKTSHISFAFLFVLLALVIYVINVQLEHIHFIATNNYGNYQVINNYALAEEKQNGNKIGTLLKINESHASFIDRKKQAFFYAEVIKKILFADLKFQHKDILVLGAGGFTLSAEKTNDNNFTYVDIDPNIKNIVQKNFLDQINGNFVAEDARVYLTKTKQFYDAIVSDAYSNLNTIPEELITFEHLKNIKTHLRVDGVAIFNIIARPTLSDSYSKRLDNTIRKVFGNCVVIPKKYSADFTNMVYVCSSGNSENDQTVYTDNFNSAMVDLFVGMRR